MPISCIQYNVVAIFCSDGFSNRKTFNQILKQARCEWKKINEIVISGTNADDLSSKYAIKKGIKQTIVYSDWSKKEFVINTDIIYRATHVVAFLSRSDKNAQNIINTAKCRSLPTIIYWID
jgi:hypothetical protein